MFLFERSRRSSPSPQRSPSEVSRFRIMPVTRYTRALLASAVLALGASGVAQAQLPQAKLHSLFPAGGQKGTTIELTLTSGADLEEVRELICSHPGLKAVPKTTTVDGKTQPVPSQFVLTIDPNTPPGVYDIRAVGMFGVSNPRAFAVGDRKEVAEVEPNNTREQATAVELNTVVNAKSQQSADLDFYKIPLKKGGRVLFECAASGIDSKMKPILSLYSSSGKLLGAHPFQSRLDPFLDFTAPEDGDYFLKVHDYVYQGDANQYVYRLTVHNGPHIDFVFPPAALPGSAGEFTLYGRNLPGGTPATIKSGGRQLEQLKVSIPLPSESAQQQSAEILLSPEAVSDGISYSLPSPTGVSNSVMVHFAGAPVVAEQEPNDTPDKSQAVTVPCDFVGQFQSLRDVDFLTFEAKAKDVYWLEVFAQRDGSKADPYLTIDQVTVDDKGVETVKRLTAQDDNTTLLLPTGFDTRSDDPSFRFVAPADGKYRVSLRDRYFESRGDTDLIYRLSIHKEQPDFRLVAVPTFVAPPMNLASTTDVTLRKGDNVSIDVLAYRIDGFAGTIDITAEGLPAGVSCGGASIGPGQNATSLIFSSSEQAAPWSGLIRIVGKARIDVPGAAAKEVVREARGGTIVWNQPDPATPAQSRVARNIALAVNQETIPFQVTAGATKVDVNQSSQILVPLKLFKRAGFDENVALTFAGQPANVQVENKPIPKGKDQELVRIFVQPNAPTGTFTLYLKSQAQVSYRKNPAAADLAQKEKEATDKIFAEVTEASKKTTEAKVAADKKAADAAAEAKKAVDAKPVADKLAVDTAAAATAAAADKAKSDKVAEELAAAGKAVAAAKEALAKALEKDPSNKALLEAKGTADKLIAETGAAEKAAAELKAAADKKATEAATAAKQAADAKVAAEKQVTDTAALAKAADEERVKADKAAADGAEKLKAITATKAAADKKATDAANVAKPANVAVAHPSTPILVTIKPGAATLAAAVPNSGNLKRGEKLEVKVTATRINGFAGPIELSFPMPAEVTGLSAAPVMIPADKNEGTLVVQATAEATEGKLPNLVVRGSMDFQGKAAVDQPIAITVTK